MLIMFSKKSFLLSIIFFAVALCFGQKMTIKGKIVDIKKQPVEFANILLQNTENKNIQQGTITEIDGHFQVEIPTAGNYQLTVSFVGFLDFEKMLNVTESIDLETITLTSTTNKLGEVVVTAERKIIEHKEGKLHFNVQASPLKSGFDGMEVLQRSPYIIIDENSGILMRNEAATILINGKISPLSGESLANYIRNIPSDQIQRIEIQTHLSANTDAESSGGVINIILKKKPVGFDGNLRSEYTIKSRGDYFTSSGLNFNYGAQKWNVYGNYNYQKNTRSPKNLGTIDYFTQQQFLEEDGNWISNRDRHNYQLGFVADFIQNHTFGVEGFATNFQNNFANKNMVTFSEQETILDEGTALLEGDGKRDLYNLTFNYTWKIDTSKSNLKFFADYSDQKLRGNTIASSAYEQGFFQNNTETNNTINNTQILALQSDFEKYFQKNWKLQLGAKLTDIHRNNILASHFLQNGEWLENDRSNAFDYDEQVRAGYVSFSKNIKKIYVEIGLRMENTDLQRTDFTQDTILTQNYTDWFPNVYLSQSLPKNGLLSLSYSRRLRRPHFQFLNNYAIKVNDFRFELGNPDLRPEYVHNFELSFRQNKQSIELYYQKVNEAINGIYFLEEQVTFYRKFNSGSQTQYGLSYNRFGNLTDWWFVRANLAAFNRKFTEEDGTDKFQRVTFSVNWMNNFKLNKTTNFELSGSYFSRYEDAFYVAFPRYRINLMLQKTFFDKKLSCRIYLNDIFNTLTYDNQRPFENFTNTQNYKPQSRRIRLWIMYNFSTKNKAARRKNKSDNEVRQRL